MNYKSIKLILFFMLCGSVLMAQSNTYSFTLEEAINFAYDNQVAMQNAKLDVEISKNKVRETVSIGLPQVNGTASIQRFIDIPTQVVPANFFDTTAPPDVLAPISFGTEYSMSYGLEASQLLFDGNYLLGLQASSVYKDLTIKALERTKIETAVNVSKAYYSVLVNRERLQLLEANIQRLKKTLDDTKAYYANGFAEKIDQDRISVLYNNLSTEKENVSRLVELSLKLLKFQIGMPVDANLSLKDNLKSIQLENVLVQETAINPEARVEYALIKTQLRLNELDYKRNIVTRAPSLVAFASFSENGFANKFQDIGKTFYPTSVIGISLKVPIIGSGQKSYQTKQAKFAMQKSQNDLNNIVNAINLEAKSSQINFTNSLASLNNQKNNMELAKEVVRVTKAKYDQGVGSSLEVTSAETALKEAETNYIAALYDAIIAKIEMDKAFGKIN